MSGRSPAPEVVNATTSMTAAVEGEAVEARKGSSMSKDKKKARQGAMFQEGQVRRAKYLESDYWIGRSERTRSGFSGQMRKAAVTPPHDLYIECPDVVFFFQRDARVRGDENPLGVKVGDSITFHLGEQFPHKPENPRLVSPTAT